MSFPRYPEYKDSGVEWLGEVPAHWEVARFSRVIAAIKDGTHGTFQRVAEGRPLLSAKNVLNGHLDIGGAESLISDSDHAEIVANGFPRKGDLLLTIVGTIGRACVYEEAEPFAFQRSVCFIRLRPELSPYFLYYFSQSKFFQEQLVGKSKSSAQAGVYMGDVASASILFPGDVNEQTAITTFLDRETAKIDTLLAEQEKLIALLQEKRQAVISHAVTKGLDPNAPMKDSGVEWLGEVPAHWEVKRLKYLGDAFIGLTYDPQDVTDSESGTLVLRSSNVQGGQIVYDDNVYVGMNIPEKAITREGDILICSRNGSRALIGKNALIDRQSAGVAFGAFMTVFRSPFNSYLRWVLNSQLFEFQSGAFLTSTINQLTVSNLYGFEIPLPPESNRKEISAFLDTATRRIDVLIAEARTAITLLQERRTALISAAVTGQIDVRNWSVSESA